jgi:hypothetical protein
MPVEQIKKILEEQLQLLSEASKGNVFDELPSLTSAMVDVVKILLTLEP